MKVFLIAMVFVSLIVGVALAMAGNIGRLLDIRRYEAQAQYTLAQAQLVDEQAEYLYAQTLQAMVARQNANTTGLYIVIAFQFLLIVCAVIVAAWAMWNAESARRLVYQYQLSAGNVPQLQPGQYQYQYQPPVQAPIYNQEAQR